MSDTRKFQTTRVIYGGEVPMEIGSIVELDDDQANSPFWKTRVHPIEQLEVATPGEGEKQPLAAGKKR